MLPFSPVDDPMRHPVRARKRQHVPIFTFERARLAAGSMIRSGGRTGARKSNLSLVLDRDGNRGREIGGAPERPARRES